jgi:hypothetical protein
MYGKGAQDQSWKPGDYLVYSEWCRSQSEIPQDEFFGRAMEERGIIKKRTSQGMVFEHLALKGAINVPWVIRGGV